MKILVTGATGFIGSSLVEKLVKDGQEVTVFSRQPGSPANLKRLKAALCYASFNEPDTLKEAARGKEIIFHLAGLINAPRELLHLYRQANVLTTRNLLRAADRSVLRAFVYCSSVAVYGQLKNLPADEKTPPSPDNLYGQSKYEAEEVCLDFFKKEQMPVSIVRPTWVYGPRDRRTFKLFKAIKKGAFAIIGDGKIRIHPLFIYDLVNAFKLCAFNEKAGGKIFLIGGEETLDLNNLVSLIAKALGRIPPRLHIPLKLAKTGAFTLENLYRPFGKKPPLSRRRLEFFTRNQQFNISRARRELSFEPEYGLPEGINITVNWYRKEGWL